MTMLKYFTRFLIAIAVMMTVTPSIAQTQGPNNSTLIAKGAGFSGYNFVGPCAVGEIQIGQGTAPICSSVLGLGTTPLSPSQLTVGVKSLSVTGADGDFSAGGNRAFMDQAGVARIGSLSGGGGANGLELWVSGRKDANFDPSVHGFWIGDPVIAAGSGPILGVQSSAATTNNPWILWTQVDGLISSHIRNQVYSAADNPEPVWSGMAARGTKAAPTAVQTGDHLAIIDGRGYNGNASVSCSEYANGWSDAQGWFWVLADGVWSSAGAGANQTNAPTAAEIWTTPPNSTTCDGATAGTGARRALRIDSSQQTLLGANSGSRGVLGLYGETSGLITIQPSAAAGTYNWNMPTTAGSSGNLLKSGGGGSTAMTWAVVGTDFAPATTGSDILLGNGGGQFAQYAGASCALNNFVLGVTSTGGVTCGQLSNPYVVAGTLINSTLADMDNSTVKCRISSGTGVPEDCTGANINTITGVTTNGTAAVGQLPGTTTNDDAAAGKVGEYLSSVIPSGSAVSIAAANTVYNLTSLPLTAGDWEIDGVINYTGDASTSVVYTLSTISATTASNTPVDQMGQTQKTWAGGSTIFVNTVPVTERVGPTRVSIASSGTYYLTVQSGYSVSTISAYGMFRARRPR